MRVYKCLSRNNFINGDFQIVPIRDQDRFAIMNWRNEQLYHLRQKSPLTVEQQNVYYETVVASLFEQTNPQQLLFSYLYRETCIGYGGLVHINTKDRNAEISFLMNTQLEADSFDFHWTTYLKMIEQVAFAELKLHKVYVYAFDLRPHLYDVLMNNGFFFDARLKEHCLHEKEFVDVVIYSKYSHA